MNDRLTFCLMTCGEETEAECLAAIEKERSAAEFVFQEVRNITPAATALNTMFAQCQTKYLVPLDADMILNANYLERIWQQIEIYDSEKDWHTILFSLWDTLTEKRIYALKVFNMETMGHIQYQDDPCPDIQHYRDLSQAGLQSIDLFHLDPIGLHVVRGDYFCYAKYRDLYMTLRSHPRDLMENHFMGGHTIRERAWNHFNYFLYRHLETKAGRSEYLYCIAGMLDGLTSPLTFKSKDLNDREMKFLYDPEAAFRNWYERDKTHRVFV